MKPHPAAMMACLLLSAPPLAAGQWPDCASEPSIRGVPISEKITFLESGQQAVCSRGYSNRDCNFAFEKMVERLGELRDELATGCKQVSKSAPAKGGRAKPQPTLSFAQQRAALESADQRLERLQQKMRENTTAMRVIREHSVGLVRHHLSGRPAAERRRAEPVLAMAADADGDPTALRAQILRLNQPGGEKATNTLWVAANALELEQYYHEQEGEAGRTRGDSRKLGDTTGRRESDMKTAGSSRSPLSELLGSPALPGLLGAAAQLAAAANKGADDSKAPEPAAPQSMQQASAASQAPPAVPLLVSKLEGPPGKEEKKEEEKKEGDEKKTDSKEASASGISGAHRYGEPDRELAASITKHFGPAPLKGGGGNGGAGGGGDATVTEVAAAEESRQAPLVENGGFDFRGGGSGGSGSDGRGYTAGGSAPSEPEPDATALAKILEDHSVDSTLGAGDAASESGGDGGPTLFHLVHAAYVRGLRAGRFVAPRQEGVPGLE